MQINETHEIVLVVICIILFGGIMFFLGVAYDYLTFRVKIINKYSRMLEINKFSESLDQGEQNAN